MVLGIGYDLQTDLLYGNETLKNSKQEKVLYFLSMNDDYVLSNKTKSVIFKYFYF